MSADADHFPKDWEIRVCRTYHQRLIVGTTAAREPLRLQIENENHDKTVSDGS